MNRKKQWAGRFNLSKMSYNNTHKFAQILKAGLVSTVQQVLKLQNVRSFVIKGRYESLS